MKRKIRRVVQPDYLERLFSCSSKFLFQLLILSVLLVTWATYLIVKNVLVINPRSWIRMEFKTPYDTVTKSQEVITFHFTDEPESLQFPADDLDDLSDNVTLVTAFFNIGSFQKGRIGINSMNNYSKDSEKLARVKNFIVLYSDDPDYIKLFESRRKELKNRTKVVLVERSSLWSFSLQSRIGKIYSSASYPKYYPNTVNPDYSCIMNAKYDVVAKAIESNYFKTKYYAWIDQGYFREFNSKGELFTIGLPPGFDTRTVCFNEVFTMLDSHSARNIFITNRIWVGGGFFLSHRKVMKQFIEQYRYHANRYLEQGLSSTDQQVLYAIYWESLKGHLERPVVPLQAYLSSGPGDPWFKLGKICIEEKHYTKL